MTQPARPYYTPEQYLALEELSQDKHEYYAGEIYLMAGGSLEHSVITSNIGSVLRQAFRGKGCLVCSSDLKIGVTNGSKLYTYPDVSVVCGKPELLPGHNDVLTNPILIVEVLSPSTATYDSNAKFLFYKSLPSFKHYLLVEQDRVDVTYHFKTEAGTWKNRTYTSLADIVKLFDFEDVELTVADFYDGIEFAE